jgi:hypothetical protein
MQARRLRVNIDQSILISRDDHNGHFQLRVCRYVGREPFPRRFVFLPMMNTFTLLSFVVTFLAGATAGAWLNALTNSYGIRAPGRSSIANR